MNDLEDKFNFKSIFDFDKEDKDRIINFIPKIDLDDKGFISNYGIRYQNKISEYSDKLLENSKKDNTAELNLNIHSLIEAINYFDNVVESSKGILSFFKKKDTLLDDYIDSYVKTENIVNNVEREFKRNIISLTKLNSTYDVFYQNVFEEYKKLNMYIVAGEEKLKQIEDNNENVDLFRKKIHNLKVSNHIASQMAAQILIMKNMNQDYLDKIKEITNHTIPLWKNQVSSILGISEKKNIRKSISQKEALNDIKHINKDVLHSLEKDFNKEN